MAAWLQNPIKGLLLDVTGVLYESGKDTAIDGSVAAIKRLQDSKLPFRLVTNETQRSRSSLLNKLCSCGYVLQEATIHAPAPVVKQTLIDRSLRPYLLVHPDVLAEFSGVCQASPNCVVVGDAGSAFSYENINCAFQVLMNSPEPCLISMGKGRYYKDKDNLAIDVGAYTAALEYASDVKAEVVGKPDPTFFQAALQSMGIQPEEAVMIGDDILSDVAAAQMCGLRGILVRTGKFRLSDANHPTVKPDAIVDNLAQAVDCILGSM